MAAPGEGEGRPTFGCKEEILPCIDRSNLNPPCPPPLGLGRSSSRALEPALQPGPGLSKTGQYCRSCSPPWAWGRGGFYSPESPQRQGWGVPEMSPAEETIEPVFFTRGGCIHVLHFCITCLGQEAPARFWQLPSGTRRTSLGNSALLPVTPVGCEHRGRAHPWAAQTPNTHHSRGIIWLVLLLKK